jgi:ABC-type sugar transport system substrate-binding protein
MLPVIKEINKAGIPLVVVDRKIYKKGQDVSWNATVAWDIPLSGAIAGAETVAALKGHGNVVVLEGDPATSVYSDRGDPFYQVLSQFPGIKVIYKAPGMFRRDTGLKVTQDLLAKFPKGTIDAIYSMNDEMTLGALEAIKAAGRLGEFKIISTDGDPAAMDALRRGEIDYNVIFHPGEQAVAVTAMAKILRGEPLDGPLTYNGITMDKLEFEGLPWFRPTAYWVDKTNTNEPGLKSSW